MCGLTIGFRVFANGRAAHAARSLTFAVCFLLFVLRCIVVHQATLGQNLTLVGCQIGEVQVQVAYALGGDYHGIDVFLTRQDGLADAWHKHHVSGGIVERGISIERERHDAPVDTVAAIAFGGILKADIGVAPQHLLAGGRLLAR